MGAMLFYLRAMQSEEASVVSPFFQAAPLFGYVLAYFVLGETAVGPADDRRRIDHRRHADRLDTLRQQRPRVQAAAGPADACLRIGRSALSALIFKIFAFEVDFWATTFWMFVGEAIFGAACCRSASIADSSSQLLRDEHEPRC